jgi:dTDP-4-dehydrorhamnose reductase
VKIALAGSDGMLGSDIVKVFSDVELVPLTMHDFDITDLNATLSAIRDIKPDCFIHSAAYTDVDGCELDPDKAIMVNGLGTRNIAMACEEVKSSLLYISTDYVFDGTSKQPYDEWDTTGPINQYGHSKLLGERFVMSLTKRFYIVRTSWLYGRSGKNFVDTISRLLSEKDEISIVNDQTGSPTFTGDLALKIKELIGKGYGIYHITNSEHCTWYDFAVEIACLRNSKTAIKPITSEAFDRPARRPAFSVLNNSMLRLEGMGEMRDWKAALKEYLSD